MIKIIGEQQHNITAKKLIRKTVKKIEFANEELEIYLMLEKLKQILFEILGISIPQPLNEPLKNIRIPYISRRAHKHVKILDYEASASTKNPFNLGSHELKNLVRALLGGTIM